MSSEQEQTAPEQAAEKPKVPVGTRLLGLGVIFVILALTFGPPVLTVAKLAGVAIGISYFVLWLPYIICFGSVALWFIVYNAAVAAGRTVIQELLIAASRSNQSTNALAAKLMAQAALKRNAANSKLN